jgi:hypothetical protein
MAKLTVPVLVVAGRLTTVHLEGPGSWTDSGSGERSNLVCLTDGQIVGYRANTSEIPASNSSATH